MIKQPNDSLKIIIAYLLGHTVSEEEMELALEQLATHPELLTIFERLEELLNWTEDPAWLEAIAAYNEGVVTPEMADFTLDREALAHLAPDLISQFEALSSETAAVDLELPPFPTFAEQWSTNQPQASKAGTGTSPDWQRKQDFEWRLREAGELIIRLLTVSVTVLTPLTPTAVKSGETTPPTETVLRRCVLEPDETGDLAVEVVISQRGDEPDTCRLTVRAESPSRWPDLAGVRVQASAGDWQEMGETDQSGEVSFEGLPPEMVGALAIHIRP